MKTWLKYIMTMVLAASCAFHSVAYDSPKNDTVYLYNSWEQMLFMEPMAMLINPEIVAYSPFSVNILTTDEEVIKQVSEEGHMAISIGDSIWLASSDYIKHEFKGDVKAFDGYVPLFFTDKVAYMTYPDGSSLMEILFGTDESYGIEKISYFIIDFENKSVKKLTHKYLSELLEGYHDLKMRYEGMKDYKKSEIIEYFFFQYINRVDQDIFKPYIIDIVEPVSGIQ